MIEEEKDYIGYKITAGKKIRVFKKEYNGRVYYNVQMQQKNLDETVVKYYRPVTFKKGITLDDPDGKGIDIIIHKGFENLRPNAKDPYNPITTIMITDFEVVERQEQKEAEAYDMFQENLNENEMENIEITDQDLPF